MKGNAMKKKICVILIAVLVAVLGTSTFFIIDHYKESNKQAALYGELAELVDAAAQTDAATEPAEQIPYSEEKMLLPELAELYQQNGDLVGWISIADTNINYPVMQSVNEPNFYLKHGFDKEILRVRLSLCAGGLRCAKALRQPCYLRASHEKRPYVRPSRQIQERELLERA